MEPTRIEERTSPGGTWRPAAAPTSQRPPRGAPACETSRRLRDHVKDVSFKRRATWPSLQDFGLDVWDSWPVHTWTW